jgi:hypothetical protein
MEFETKPFKRNLKPLDKHSVASLKSVVEAMIPGMSMTDAMHAAGHPIHHVDAIKTSNQRPHRRRHHSPIFN